MRLTSFAGFGRQFPPLPIFVNRRRQGCTAPQPAAQPLPSEGRARMQRWGGPLFSPMDFRPLSTLHPQTARLIFNGSPLELEKAPDLL
jgi:hypothetical protein